MLDGVFEAPLPRKGFFHSSASNHQFYLVLGASVSALSVAVTHLGICGAEIPILKTVTKMLLCLLLQ